jgi:His-Xaa-Ser system radical SAM maturase HxsB
MKLNYFNFKKLNDKILLTNDFGRYVFVTEKELKKIVTRKVEEGSELWNRLLESHMIYDETDLEYSANNKYELREIKNYVNSATGLHIFVVNTACNMNCVYCQANNGKERPHLFMNQETAERAVDIALQSPSRHLNFEFQGGEPLLNFEVIRKIVEYAEENKGNHVISYNVVTNLTLLTDEIIGFLIEHNFGISTSVDGSKLVHDANRPFLDGKGTYEKVLKSVQKLRDAGICVGAIETTTRLSLKYPREIVRAYSDMGFDSIFIRPLTPLGKATVNWDDIGYTPDEFNEFYYAVFEEILKINKAGIFMREDHATILLRRISGQSVNYMELRSPCGAGIGQMAYFADGNIFTCDEGRMLYEMGFDTFRLGSVYESNYTELIETGVCRTVCASSILESIPTCCDCVYQPYCGTCPVVNYAHGNDVMEKNPRGYRCRIYSGMLDYLFSKFMESEPETIRILKSWSS